MTLRGLGIRSFTLYNYALVPIENLAWIRESLQAEVLKGGGGNLYFPIVNSGSWSTNLISRGEGYLSVRKSAVAPAGILGTTATNNRFVFPSVHRNVIVTFATSVVPPFLTFPSTQKSSPVDGVAAANSDGTAELTFASRLITLLTIDRSELALLQDGRIAERRTMTTSQRFIAFSYRDFLPGK
jgi:hypothetical protein